MSESPRKPDLDLNRYRRELERRAAEVAQVLLPHFPDAEHHKVEQFALLAVSIFDNTEPFPAPSLDARRAAIKRLKTRAVALVKDATTTKFANVHRSEWAQRAQLATVMGTPHDLEGPAQEEIQAAERLSSARKAMTLAVGQYLSALKEMERLTPPPKRTGRRAENALVVVAALWWQTFDEPPTTTNPGPFWDAAAALLRIDDPTRQVRRAVAAVLELGPPGPPPPSAFPAPESALAVLPTKVR